MNPRTALRTTVLSWLGSPFLTVSLLLGIPRALFAQCPPGPAVLFLENGAYGIADAFGFSVATAGDVNGDGVPDVLVGAPSGPSSGYAKIFSGADASDLLTFTGSPSGGSGYFGGSVAGIGDVTGDGVPDVLVGDPAYHVNSPVGLLLPMGIAKVYSGATGAEVFTLGPFGFSDVFARSVAGVGDVTGDGVPDIAVGATQFYIPIATPVYTGPGYVKVFSGANGTEVFTIPGAWNVEANGGQGGSSLFGHSVSGAGDVDGDGVPDLIVGGPRYFPPLWPNQSYGAFGQARVFSGATGTQLWAFAGGNGDEFGYSVAGVGDVDGDGHADLIVGAPLELPGQGYARVFSGATGAALFTFNEVVTPPPGLGDPILFGGAVAGPGDLDGDGTPDVVVGAPHWVSWLSPVPIGYVKAFSGASGAEIATLIDDVGTFFGGSVAGAGDLNGDGKADLIVGDRADGGPFGFGGGGRQVKVFSLSAPTGGAPFGAGCPGSGGGVPTIGTSGGASCMGNASFAATLTGALGGTVSLLAIGLSAASSSVFGQLPLDLSATGVPGCSLLVSSEFLLPAVTNGAGVGAGSASVPLPIPPDPALLGRIVYLQWYVVDPGPLPVPGSMSRGLPVVIG